MIRKFVYDLTDDQQYELLLLACAAHTANWQQKEVQSFQDRAKSLGYDDADREKPDDAQRDPDGRWTYFLVKNGERFYLPD